MLKAGKLLWILLIFGAFMAFGHDRAEAKTVLASWYGPGFHGQPTASGEIYDAYGYTAAHKTLPLGTEITVTYAGRSVDVVVNDRGPYSGGRELDLSQGAAEYLGLTAAGVDYVDYQISGSGGYAAEDQYAAQTSASEDQYASADTGYAEADYAGQGSGAADYAAKYDDGSGRSSGGGGGDRSGDQGSSGGSYEVQSGDTLTGIASDLGTSVDQLMQDNDLSNPDVIFAGQSLDY